MVGRLGKTIFYHFFLFLYKPSLAIMNWSSTKVLMASWGTLCAVC